MAVNPDVNTLPKLLKSNAEKFGANVAIKPKANGGEINITYKNDQDLERILKLLV